MMKARIQAKMTVFFDQVVDLSRKQFDAISDCDPPYENDEDVKQFMDLTAITGEGEFEIINFEEE